MKRGKRARGFGRPLPQEADGDEDRYRDHHGEYRHVHIPEVGSVINGDVELVKRRGDEADDDGPEGGIRMGPPVIDPEVRMQ